MSEDVIQTLGERRELGIADARVTETVPEYRVLRFLATLSQIINLVNFMLVLHPTKLQNFQRMLSVVVFCFLMCVRWGEVFFFFFFFLLFFSPKLEQRFNI